MIRQATLVPMGLLLLLLTVACGGGAPTTTYQYTGYLSEEIPPCTPVEGLTEDPCQPDERGSGADASITLGEEPREMDIFLNVTEVHVAHLVVRGNFLPNTVRCKIDPEDVRPHQYTDIPWRGRVIQCFTDIRVNAYVLGSGPATLTVKAGHYGFDFDEAEQERISVERSLSNNLPTNEAMFFVGPSTDLQVATWQLMGQWRLERRDDGTVVAVHPLREYWRTRPTDYQTFRSALEMELPAFSQAVMEAHQARLTAHGGRTGPDANFPMLQTDANNLDDFFTEIGAYDHPNGPPVKPPPACGRLMTEYNSGLMLDCSALLNGKDALRGTGTLNWDTGTAMASWDGVTTERTPARVTKVLLPSEGLAGTIPASMGGLSELTHLDLSNNSLTGEIPPELGGLDNLEEIRLSGNSLTGCIPYGLKDVATNDLASLNLLYCPPPPELTAGISTETTMPLSWTPAANTTAPYRVEYRRDYRYEPWITDAENITATSHTVDGLLCTREYEFRVSAHGDGTVHPAIWSPPSAVLERRAASCSPPEFAVEKYHFTVAEDASLGTVVGTVQATDDSGGPVAYELRHWPAWSVNTGEEYSQPSHYETITLDGKTGVLTVTLPSDLAGRGGQEFGALVYAIDEAGGETEIEVDISVLKSCASGTAVSNPGSNPGLVGDCRTLLGLRSALAGTATLNWSADTAMSNWDGVTTGGTPRRVTQLVLNREGLSGVVPAELGDLDKLERLVLDNNELMGELPSELGNLAELQVIHLTENDLTGEIPEELGNLSNLTALWLAQNELTGEIPSELGGLTALTQLWLSENDLTGPIPAELGSLSGLEWLWLSYNDLSGTIPAELTDLANLTLLQLDGNNLEGCIPPSLRDVDINDLSGLGLSDCQQGPAAPTGVSASLMNDTFTVTWTALSGVGEYEAQWRIGGSGGTWEALPAVTTASATYTPTGGPQCSTAYEFRVRARGDGYTHATHWGPESAAFTVETESCPPEFDDMSYDFDVAENAEVDDHVGTVSATDPDTGDTVSYAITAGNTGNAFAIGSGTGDITVAAALDHETTPSYTLTVEAEDDHGKTDTVTVTVTVTDVVEDAPPAPGNLSATLLSGTFTLSWDAVTGATKYEAQHTTDASDAGTVTWTALTETTGTTQDYTPAGGVACNTEYRFRVRAYGDGTAYLAGWGAESTVESVMSGPCDNAPEFDESSYGLTVAEDAATGSSVGTVVATDADVGDTVSYSIIAGNDDGKFAMDGGTGEITVAAALDAAELAFHVLTVEARDGYGYTDTAQVGIALLLTECSNGTVVPNPSSNPKLVRDCSMLLTARDALVGDGGLNWSATRRINNWRGVVVGSTQNRGSYVERVQLPNRGLTGSIRPEIGGLRDLLELTLTSNDLTGEIPPELGQLVNLDDLTLSYNELTGEIPGELGELTGLGRLLLNSNQLTGEIPPELGRLASVSTLWLQRNRLTGEIPPELGGLAGAVQIHLHTNRLTGPIPWQLTELTALTTLQIAGNQLEGCVPPALRRLASNDMGLLGLSDCTEEGPAPAPGGLNATLAGGTFTVTWSAVTGAEEYEVQHRVSGSDDEWESLPAVTGTTDTYTPAGGPLCGATYEFRVRSYGDAVTYAAGWGPTSTPATVTTSTCSS